MKIPLHALPLAAFALLVAVPLSAQSIDGTWITEFDRMMRNEGGTVTTGEKSRARVTLVQKGDSVTGTWLALGNTRGGTPTPRQLSGTIAGGKVSLQTQFDATVNINGEQSTRTITVLYDFALKGERLEGTITNRSGDMDMPPLPFSAWREPAEKK
jgi:hypothetical protein